MYIVSFTDMKNEDVQHVENGAQIVHVYARKAVEPKSNDWLPHRCASASLTSQTFIFEAFAG